MSGSSGYWENRYRHGGNSGAGSYNRLAEFKANVINDFIEKNDILSVIEWGCGDGNQLALLKCPEYTGIDISKTAIQNCTEIFQNDPRKMFYEKSDYHPTKKFDLSLSLDVIYHLVEYDVFSEYIYSLFQSSRKFVCIYASNTEDQISNAATHVKHRKFTDHIQQYYPNWKLYEYIPNAYPYDPEDQDNTSFADFYIFQKE